MKKINEKKPILIPLMMNLLFSILLLVFKNDSEKVLNLSIIEKILTIVIDILLLFLDVCCCKKKEESCEKEKEGEKKEEKEKEEEKEKKEENEEEKEKDNDKSKDNGKAQLSIIERGLKLLELSDERLRIIKELKESINTGNEELDELFNMIKEEEKKINKLLFN